MTDYGHALAFGSFTTPSSADPTRTVALAVIAEQAGLDLVTFQDHPYQPAFLDTWTLLSFVAARTSTVRLSANVTNLPLRPPAVLARSIAGLDLLSGGRVELGLGAGGFWDAMEAMGARRLTSAESVRALEEAIDVIRQVWNVDARGGVRADGEFYRVHGAKRGPAAAHDVSIWLGAYRPRMLALTGRRADGWLPSMSYLQPGDLAAGNSRIDQAAEEAGRSPRDIRRLLNVTGHFASASHGPLDGPADQWAEELADLALTDGISIFILASDNEDDLRCFGGEVAPAVRELVQGERGIVASPSSDATGPAARGTSAVPPPTNQARSSAVARGRFAVIPTPDDGTRLSGRRVWDESTRPRGPLPDPERTYTAQEQANGRHLVEVHDVLRDELTQVFELVDEVAAGMAGVGAGRSRINAMTIRQNKRTRGGYCESNCRLVTAHHMLEHRPLFPGLRRGVPGLAPVIERLEEEHQTTHEVIEGVDRALVAFVATRTGSRSFVRRLTSSATRCSLIPLRRTRTCRAGRAARRELTSRAGRIGQR